MSEAVLNRRIRGTPTSTGTDEGHRGNTARRRSAVYLDNS